MADRPLTESAHAETDKPSSVNEEFSSEEPLTFSHGLKVSQWLTYAALALAVIAVVLAALAYFLPANKSGSIAQQGGDAKANVCAAYASTKKAVVINTHMQSPNINDQVAELAVATNARLALIGGGAYLRDRLEANTAAPADLANAANTLATTVEQLGMNYMTEAGNDVQNPLRENLNNQITQLDKLCG